MSISYRRGSRPVGRYVTVNVYFLTVSAKNPTLVSFVFLPLRVFACKRDFLNLTVNLASATVDATKTIVRELHSKFFESLRFFPLIVCELFN